MNDEAIETISRGSPAKGRTDWAKVDALDDAQIAAAVRDDADAVPLDFDWSDAEVVLPERKTPISIRVDADVLDFFRSGGAGYQRRINAVLRSYVEAARRRGGK